MAKQKERSEVEHLRSENRNLKSQVRNLKKQLSRKEKREVQFLELEEQVKDFEIEIEQVKLEPPKSEKCPKCSHSVEVVDLGIKLLLKCKNCNHRETRKKSG